MILIDMREKYARHIGIEETNVFPLAGRILPPEELQVIAYEMAQRRGELALVVDPGEGADRRR
jgi:hemerythrin-like domain-containing protein